MISFERLDINQVPWPELDSFEDRTIFQTLPWLKFVSKTQGAEPVIAAITENGRELGYFTGLMVRKYGVKILGSPFKGWTTSYMGFNLRPGNCLHSVLEALPSFAFNDLGCHYLEIMDRNVLDSDYLKLPYAVTNWHNSEIDLTQSEAELFNNMQGKSCRYMIRKAAKLGVTIEEASDLGFAEDYHRQLQDVFAKQSLVPTYRVERVLELIRYLYPGGHLLLLRAKNSDGYCIGTGIFPAFNDTAYFWGGASWRQGQHFGPNEPIIWYAMRYWKNRGIKKFDMGGGGGGYKRKYGGYEILVPRLMMPKYNFIISLRNLAQRAWKTHQIVSGKFAKLFNKR